MKIEVGSAVNCQSINAMIKLIHTSILAAITALISVDSVQSQTLDGAILPTHADLAYGEYERQKLDLYLTDSSPTGLVLFIHGGSFLHGDKSGISATAIQKLHEHGIHVASINYRYSSKAAYPAPMHDAARAVQFLRLHADEYGIDPTRISVWGESAGGGIALWLALHDDLAEPDSDTPLLQQSTRLCGAVGILAQSTYDPFVTDRLFPGVMAEQSKPYQLLFGCKNAEELQEPQLAPLLADASPVSHVTPDDPPIYLIYKNDPEEVPADAPLNLWVHHRRQGEFLVEKLKTAGVPYVLQIGGDNKESFHVAVKGDYLDFLVSVTQGQVKAGK
ncbi:MAG: alpha/beta hydrolase [Phycisphaeraceae bacterium]|nr:alpha/beta hydrolase [Phycisphaeraceae bacterium]